MSLMSLPFFHFNYSILKKNIRDPFILLIIARLYNVNKLFDCKFKMYESDAIFINELSRYEHVGLGLWL